MASSPPADPPTSRHVVRLAGWWARTADRIVAIRLLDDLVRRYQRTNAGLLVGSLAYRQFLFLVPSVLVIFALAGRTAADGGDIEAEVDGRMRLGPALGSALSTAGRDASSGWRLALTVGVTGVLVSGFGLYATLFRCYAQAWELAPGTVRRRFASAARFVGGLILFVLFLFLMGWVRRHGAFLGTAGVVVSILVDLVLFVVMSVALPHRGDDILELVPGALTGGLAVVGLQVATALWIPGLVASRSATYGTLGVALAVLAYLAILGFILVLVPLVNATWHDHRLDRSEAH